MALVIRRGRYKVSGTINSNRVTMQQYSDNCGFFLRSSLWALLACSSYFFLKALGPFAVAQLVANSLLHVGPNYGRGRPHVLTSAIALVCL
jgi:hypothetical protein